MNEIKNLQKKIHQAKLDYYNGEASITDEVYDALFEELKALDPKNPELFSVGAEPTKEWHKVKHIYPLGSLNKVNNESDMSKWIFSTLKTHDLLVAEKLDGLSIGLQYEDGALVKAPLRGNGYEAEDILVNVLKMKGIVKKIPEFTGVLRGEIILTKSDHKTYFSDYSSTRNAASGICRRLDGVGCEHLTVMFYQVLGGDFTTESSQFEFLKKNGCLTPNYKLCKSDKEVNLFWQEYVRTKRSLLNWDIDGLVVSCDDIETQNKLGSNGLYPKSKLAFKFPNETGTSIVRKIDFQVGSAGRIVPVATLDPVNILGAEITRASIYNMAYLQKLELDVGAKVLVSRAGDIIPRIEENLVKTGTVLSAPKSCPSCSGEVEMQGEYLVCKNSENCSAQISGRVKNYVANLNILELGDTLIDKLLSLGLIKDVADLYCLSKEQFASIDRMGDKSASNVYNSIDSTKSITLDVFLGSLSIPNVAVNTIKLIMDAGHDSLEKIQKLSVANLQNIHGLGPQKAQSLFDGLISNKSLIEKLLSNGVNIKTISGGKLYGKSFAFTGAAKNPRKLLEKLVVSNGGTVKTSVVSGLSYLVIADVNSTSTKAIKAKSLGTTLISEDDFIEMAK